MTDRWGTALECCDEILRTVSQSRPGPKAHQICLSLLQSELSAQWISLMTKTPQWVELDEHGRRPVAGNDWWPFDLFDDALDDERTRLLPFPDASEMQLLVVPLTANRQQPMVMLVAGRHLDQESCDAVTLCGRILGHVLSVEATSSRTEEEIVALRRTMELTAGLAHLATTEEVLIHLAEAATDLLECDRSSIFLWNKKHKTLTATPALGMKDNSLTLPDNTGLVGQVLETGESLILNDPYSNPIFNAETDKQTGYTTKSLLAVPLRDVSGKILGVFEVLNRNQDEFTETDSRRLELLGVQASAAIKSSQNQEQLSRQNKALTEKLAGGVQIIGKSPVISALRETVHRLASTDLPVLVLGESGTGKEVFSQALHYQGPRADKPFVAINCAAINESLLESELFGHEQGAFTDARQARAGSFELADGGTIFLDEIGDMSLGGQAKLLRVLEQKQVTRVGGSRSIPVDVRIVAATNANLTTSVSEKKFRQDLYYRLSVVALELPPLRQRLEDVIELGEFFLERFAHEARRQAMTLSDEARRKLQQHTWPGNIRELRNLMERVAFLAPGTVIQEEDLQFANAPEQQQSFLEPHPGLGLSEATLEFQREYIRKAIKLSSDNMSEAARLLGLHRSNLYRKMRQLEMHEAGEEDEQS